MLDRSTLLAAVWRVHAGEVVVDPKLVRSLIEAPTIPPALARLSERERQVLSLMAEDLTDRGIAERLVVSPEDRRHPRPAHLRPARHLRRGGRQPPGPRGPRLPATA